MNSQKESKKSTSRKPLVSVCVITFNQEKYISQCIESILNQKTNFEYEILVNDDHSTDNTVNILKKYETKHPGRLKLVLQKENLYSKGLRNFIPRFLLPKAVGKYFAICEGDDYWIDDHKLQKQVDLLEKNKDLALCFGPTKVVFEDNEQEPSIWPAKVSKSMLTVLSLAKENYIPTNSVMYRMQKYDKYSFDPAPGDWYMHLYHAQYGKIGYIKDVMSVYRRHKEGLWWNDYNNSTKHLENTSARMLDLLSEAAKIYNNDRQIKKQISSTAKNLILRIVNSKNSTESAQLKKAIGDHSEFVMEYIKLISRQIKKQESLVFDLENETSNVKLINRNLEEKVEYLQKEVEGLNNSPLVGRTIRAARLKARVVEDISLNKGAAIRRKVYRKTLQKPIDRARNSYIQKRLKYSIVENKRLDKTRPLVSVVIPFYNRHETIIETLDSINQQTFTNFEVILVDDGSTDELSISILGKIKKHPTKPLVIKQENKGVAAARNNGIKQSRGRYIMCLDSDDVIRPLYIEKCVTVLESDPDVSMVTTGIEAFGVSSWTHIHQPFDPLQLFAVNLAGTASMYRKEASERCRWV